MRLPGLPTIYCVLLPLNPKGCLTVQSRSSGTPRGKSVSKRHLTIAEVCEDLDITRSTFYEWRAKRKGPPSFKLPNGEVRIRRNAYEDWLSSLEDAA